VFPSGRGSLSALRNARSFSTRSVAIEPPTAAPCRAQVTEVALICNRILAATGAFAHPHAIRNDLMSAIIALELAELQLSRMLFP